MHEGLAPDEPDGPRRIVVVDRLGVAREALPGGALGDPVEPDPDAPRGKLVPIDPNRFTFVCRCGVAAKGRPVGDHRCEPPPDPWGGADRSRLGLGRKARSAARPEPAPAPQTTRDDEGAPPTPAPEALRKPRFVRSTNEAPVEPVQHEAERTSDPLSGNWLE